MLLPALSTAVPLMVCSPCVVVVIGEGHVAMPDKASEQVKVTVALGPKMIPLLFGPGETAALITGGVSSMLTVAHPCAVLPATSTAVPHTCCPAPSVLKVTAAGQVAIPETESLHVKLTTTLVLFHPATFGLGVMTGVAVGGVRSSLTVVVVLAVCPAASVTLALIWFMPSVLTVCAAGHCNGATPPLHV